MLLFLLPDNLGFGEACIVRLRVATPYDPITFTVHAVFTHWTQPQEHLLKFVYFFNLHIYDNTLCRLVNYFF